MYKKTILPHNSISPLLLFLLAQFLLDPNYLTVDNIVLYPYIFQQINVDPF